MNTFGHIKQLTSESMVYGISGTLARSIGIFLIPIYTRIFSPSDYGIIALISTITSLIFMLIVLGLGNSSTRWFYDSDKVLDQKYTISSWFWCQLSVSCIVAIGLFLFAPQVSFFLLKSKDHAILIRIAALAIPFKTFSTVLGNWLRYQRRAWATTIVSTANSLGTIGIIALLVLFYRWGLVGIYSAELFAAVIMAFIAAVLLKTWINPVFFSWARLKEMLIYGLPLVPASAADWITNFSDRFILQMFYETAEVGLYSISAGLASGVALVTGAFQMAWGPFAFSIYREEESLNVYAKVFSLYALVFCFLGTLVSLFSPLLLRILTTPEYYDANSCVPYLVFSYITLGAIYVISTGSAIVKRSTPIAIASFIAAVINIILNFVLIPHYGKEGAAIATLFSYLGMIIYRYHVSQKDYRIPFHPWHMVNCFGLSCVLIAIDHFFISTYGVSSFCLRAGMCLLFIPLSFCLKIVRFEHPKQLIIIFCRRMKRVMT